MLVSLYHHYPSLPPKTLTDYTLSPFPISKTLTFKNPNNKKPSKPTKSLIRSSIPDSQTLPQSAIQRIAEKLRSLGFTDQNPNPNPNSDPAGEIFIPLPNKLPKYRVGHTLDTSWSTPESPVPDPGTGKAIVRFHELRKEWKREKENERKLRRREGIERVPSLAELNLVPEELRRLTRIGIELRKKLKVGKAGITEGIVNGIHERWRRYEVVKIVCEDLCRLNMKRTHDLLERKTGGMVVWRSGSKIILYRGANYKYPYFLSDKVSTSDTLSDQDIDDGEIDQMESPSSSMDGLNSPGPSPTNKKTQPALVQGVGSPNKVRFQLPGEAQLLEEADSLLDGLGPRFNDWWGYEPLPVDGDLLPAIIPGYRRPFRLLPYGVQPKLTNAEMTTLRRLGRPLRCHFVLGRNRKLHGLAAAIVKLWEKCEIAKIAVKRGVQNTNSELMAEELKWLTGGTLLSRDKEFIVFYRGKDFLPSVVSSAIEERRKHVIYGEKQSEECSASSQTARELKLGNIKCYSKDEFGGTKDQKNIPISEPKRLRSTEAAIDKTSMKLAMALEKKAKAEELLVELEKAEIPQQQDLDKEGITEEERYMLRKVGLRLKPFLLMGRRGAFAGTIENMHLHWKYRELVKVICKERSIDAVNEVARTLEVESGGVLVAVERVSKGYAIIVYRGKNYERPTCLRPQTLLNKRQAMKRSLEAQRRQSLKLHVLKLTRNIDELKVQLDKDKEANSEQSIDESRLFLAGDKHGADSSSMDLNNGMDDTINSIQGTQQDKLVDLSLSCDGTENQFKSESESVCEETHDSVITSMHGEGGAIDSTSCPDNFMSEGMSVSAVINTEHCVSDNEPTESKVRSAKSESEPSDPMVIKSGSNEPMESSVRSAKSESELSDSMVIKTGLNESMESSVRSAKSESELPDPIVIKTGLNEMTSRAVHLSNRDRLLLRKQALKMKKRPVLAVGRSNIVTGVAKQIKAHFERHPLAIVNIKGRAKGTSVQEVVFKLEQATGAVLVSQEPSKVILYRGWGAGDEPRHTDKKNAGDVGKTSAGRAGRARSAVSHELMAAIKLECGLQRSQEEGASPEAGT